MARKTMLVMVVGAAALVGGGVAWATGAIVSVVAADGTVYGCYAAGGQLRVVSESQACRPNESRIQLLGVTAKAADSDKLDGKDSNDFYAAGSKVGRSAHADVADQAGDADTVDGKHAADFYAAGSKVADADALDGRDSAAFQARVGGTCAPGSAIRSVAGDGSVACEADDDTTYTGADFALSSQACPAGKVVTEVKADGALQCDGQLQGPEGDKGDKGETGPQGPAGVSGYLISTSGPTYLGSGAHAGMVAFCPVGTKVVGGGAELSDRAGRLLVSKPQSNGGSLDEWYVEAANDSTTLQLGVTVYAICADAS